MGTTTTELRWYSEGRKRGATARDALDYAKAHAALAESDLDWGAVPDEDGGLAVVLADSDGQVVAAVGGVDVPFTVSDHGNVIYDERDVWLVTLAASLLEDVGS